MWRDPVQAATQPSTKARVAPAYAHVHGQTCVPSSSGPQCQCENLNTLHELQSLSIQTGRNWEFRVMLTFPSNPQRQLRKYTQVHWGRVGIRAES